MDQAIQIIITQTIQLTLIFCQKEHKRPIYKFFNDHSLKESMG
jgi:hypothetical protein